MSNADPLVITMPIRIKAYEIDSMGIVSNIVYVRWFEDLRHLFLDKYFPLSEMLKQEKSPLLMKTEAEYRLPLTIHDEPMGHLFIGKMGQIKWELRFEISTNEAIHCLGKQTGCFFDMKTGRPTPFPEEFLAQFPPELTGRR